MTQDWKAGERVTVRPSHNEERLVLARRLFPKHLPAVPLKWLAAFWDDGAASWRLTSVGDYLVDVAETRPLHPLPAPDPLTAADKAVAEAADAWEANAMGPNGNFCHLSDAERLAAAIVARRALLNPRDLVQELIDAWRDTWRDVESSGVHTNERIWKAIMALEADRKRKD